AGDRARPALGLAGAGRAPHHGDAGRRGDRDRGDRPPGPRDTAARTGRGGCAHGTALAQACVPWSRISARRMQVRGGATSDSFGDLVAPYDARRRRTGARVMGDHLVVLHSAVRACAGYSRHEAPSILLEGSSISRDVEHGRAITAQLTRRHGTLEEAIDAGVFALGAAGLSKGIRRQARAACEDYFFNRLGLTP